MGGDVVRWTGDEWAAKMERRSGNQVDSGGVARDDS